MTRGLLFFACLALAAPADAGGPYRTPRTAFGQPDLQGQWTNASLTRLERPQEFDRLILPEAQARAIERAHDGKPTLRDEGLGQADSEWWEMGGAFARIRGQARSSWIVDPPDGRIPYAEAGRKALAAGLAANSDGPEGRTATDRCLSGIGSPAGPPMLNASYNGNYQILQTKDRVVILVEMIHDVRIIPLDGGNSPPAPGTPWMGNSSGHWEGDTLVIETRGFNAGDSIRGSGSTGWSYSSPHAVVRERLTRISREEILYEFTVEDSKVYARPWRAEMIFRPAKGPMFEFACHEGNYSMRGILGGARAAEAAASAAPPRTAP